MNVVRVEVGSLPNVVVRLVVEGGFAGGDVLAVESVVGGVLGCPKKLVDGFAAVFR